MPRVTLSVLAMVIVASCLIAGSADAQREAPPARSRVEKLHRDGNYKEAYEGFRLLTLDPDADPRKVGSDLNYAVACLRQLGNHDQIDAYMESVIDLHKGNWRLLSAAADRYIDIEHFGTMVGGEFERGRRRGARITHNAYERDRARALQLVVAAVAVSAAEPDKPDVAQLHLQLARHLMGNRGYDAAWRLQYLTDLDKLPDYEEGHYSIYERHYWGGQRQGAPVDEDGNPIYYTVPESWQAAENDGQRWRWALAQAARIAPDAMAKTEPTDTGERLPYRLHESYELASFMLNQLGVQTMAEYGHFFGRRGETDETRKDESGTYELHTLAEDETIAKLATGIKRFKLPDEFNYMRTFRARADEGFKDAALKLARIFENRRQYPKAADFWRKYGNPSQVAQIVGNWGQFEPIVTQPAGQGATVDFRFRNGKKVTFTAHALKVKDLLDDVKAHINAKPRQLDWQKTQVDNIGWRLVHDNQKKYMGEKAAEWTLDLEPRENHFDRRITVKTPLEKAGAYLLRAQMADGNTSLIIIWVADMAIVNKPLDKQPWYFVADAVTGQPVAKANVEFFGFWQEYQHKEGWPAERYVIHTRNFAEFTDADGQCMPTPDQMPQNFRWLTIATTDDGRLAFHGFSNAWYSGRHDPEYKQAKAFAITDRPVYRPGQSVKFKFWVNTARYDAEGKSDFAGQTFTVRVHDPLNEKFHEVSAKADEYGGFDGEFELGKEARLGQYQIFLPGSGASGSGTFRVEEYKKPEFEVKVEAPEEPVMLGEKVTARIAAKYYFGAPVTEARVSYKVLRSEHSAQWYPIDPWDWFYGRGYWWFVADYPWYPGWTEWGCRRPIFIWWPHWHPPEQPEVIAQGEAQVDAEGRVSIEIDTALAKAMYGDKDHKYSITAEVTDASRRTIVGTGEVLVARKPFKVYTWVNRGYYRSGDTVIGEFFAQTLDSKPVQGKGLLKLLKIEYQDGKPVERVVQQWELDTNVEGRARQQMTAAQAGQYRLSYTLTDAKGRDIEGGYIFVVRGDAAKGDDFRFNDIELVPNARQYAPGEKVSMMINTDRADSFVLLFVRATNGVYLKPQVLRLAGKSTVEEIEVVKKDMPNFFVEALTVSNGRVHSEIREIVVPPEDRALKVSVKPSAEKYKPGEKATMEIQVRDMDDNPVVGSAVVSIYDKSVEYISGGSNVPEIKEFFWKWRRHHRPSTSSSLDKREGNMILPKADGMSYLGVFGHSVADELELNDSGGLFGSVGSMNRGEGGQRLGRALSDAPPAPMEMMKAANGAATSRLAAVQGQDGEGGDQAATVEPTIRTQFADTALWVAAVETNEAGRATVELTMPENLTTWKTRVWTMSSGARCGEGTVDVVTTKNLIVRLQAPRFFVQKDEVVLSANVHNYLETAKQVTVVLEMEGGCMETLRGTDLRQIIEVEANGAKRVDWRVRVTEPGEAKITMKALTDEESDAMAMSFPVYVHGMLKTESFSGALRPEQQAGGFTIRVPAERRPEQSRLEIRYSPTLAAAMVDALPYMAEYPYGCTEQSLNRFLPTVITQKVLLGMGLNLKDIEQKRTNLNAQEIGDDVERAKQWKRFDRNPVFDEAEVEQMVKAGVEKLTSMQCTDGGWGWFSGWGERSWPHTTAVVVRGLLVAKANDVAIVPGVLNRGIEWLKRYQKDEIQKLKNFPSKTRPHKQHADNMDAFAFMVLVDAGADSAEMREFLYRDRTHISVYAKAMFALALHNTGQIEMRDMLRRNVEQFLVQDDENQTAYLKLPPDTWWWFWYGSEIEANAYYLKLLSRVDPQGPATSRLVKYMLNNRKHATYWNSTRDTALAVEAFADYMKASGEDKPDMTVEVLIDGRSVKTVKISAENLFTFDNKLVLEGDEVSTGEHVVELRKTGTGPLYYNAYLTNFTLEDPITKAGLEIKVERNIYKLVKVDAEVKARGQRGQAVDKKVEKYERVLLENMAMLKSGDLVEVDLILESKNDYEYLMFEDMKAAGFEPVEVRSGYGNNDIGAYMELRDERVTFFVRWLARGRHSVSYRLRAEIPGTFSALPTKASAMYAPELRANSDEIRLRIED